MPPPVRKCAQHLLPPRAKLTYFVSVITVVPGKRDTTGTQGLYYPIVFPNDFWMVCDHFSVEYLDTYAYGSD
jgi:hypothetical protein